MEYLQVLPIHHCKEFIVPCCDLINSEWPRSKTARLQSLFMSCDKFPTSLILLLNDETVVGHVRLSEIKLKGDDVMVESVVIHKEHRGKGWGKILMEDAEVYIRSKGKKVMYLSTRGQEGFYKKLGFEVCQPVMFFGFCDITPPVNETIQTPPPTIPPTIPPTNAPPPPPLPAAKIKNPLFRRNDKNNNKNRKPVAKVYMCKNIW